MPIDLSNVKIHSIKRKNGLQVSCTWRFNDGTPTGIKERVWGYGTTHELAMGRLKKAIDAKQKEYSYGAFFR